MTHSIAQTATVAFVLAFAIWMYASVISSKMHKNPEKAKKFARKFRLSGFALALPCFIVGLLYRSHVISLTLAGILYIPEVVGFAVGIWRLQPYLTAHEEEMNHD